MSKKSPSADPASDQKKKGDDASDDSEPAMIACSCGNMVAVGEPFCNICGTILEATTGGDSTSTATPPGSMEPPHGREDTAHEMPDSHAQSVTGMYPPPMQSTTPPAMQGMYGAPGGGGYPSQNVYPQQTQGGYGQMPAAASPMSNTSLYPGGPCSCGAMLAPGQSYCGSCGQTVPPGGHRAPFYAQSGGTLDAAGRPSTRRERVLIVDHEADTTAYLQRVLSLELYEALVASDGHDGLILAITAQPDLILLDLDLPGLDGFALCRVLRANLQTRNTPIIVVTGRASAEDEIHALKSGADDYLLKPVDSARLLARIEAQLRRVRSRR